MNSDFLREERDAAVRRSPLLMAGSVVLDSDVVQQI
jgi:hypothetical protein